MSYKEEPVYIELGGTRYKITEDNADLESAYAELQTHFKVLVETVVQAHNNFLKQFMDNPEIPLHLVDCKQLSKAYKLAQGLKHKL